MPKTTPSYYEALGVPPSASMSDIKKAWRAQARRCHPDFNPQDPQAPEKFKAVLEAYETLGDPERRTRYDRSNSFVNAKWTETRDPQAEHPTPDEEDAILEELRRRARASSPPPDEPLGPRSEAARKAAEAMRQRIHQAEQAEFWKTERAEARQSPGTPPPPDAAPADPGGPSEPSSTADATTASSAAGSSSSSSQRSTRSAGKKESPPSTGKPSGKTAEREPGQETPSPERPTRDARASLSEADPLSQVRPPPGSATGSLATHGSAGGGLRGVLLSPWVSGVLFLFFLTLACVAFVTDPPRAAFFAVLAFGAVTWRLLLEIRIRLERLEKRLR